MRVPKPGQTYFFVDESGDPVFYDRRGNLIVGQPGCSPILILGFVETQSPKQLRQAIVNLQEALISDPYFDGVPSLAKTAIAFHAKDDVPEIRYRFFQLLTRLDFRAQFVVARKIERVFKNRFKGHEMAFYDHLVSLLFENVLHRYSENVIYFAKRGSRDRQLPLSRSIGRGIGRFEEKWHHQIDTTFKVQAQTPRGEPCLSVVDYMCWAVHRAFVRGQMRYYRTIEDKVSLLVDLYDTKRYPKNWYDRGNPFDVTKITPL
jgi:hypothetical protein